MLVISGDRTKVEQDRIPEFFTPVTGNWQQKNLFKVYADDESYNSGHGHAYEAYGVDPAKGALVIVRPDHCEFCFTQKDNARLVSVFGLYTNKDITTDIAKVSALDDGIEQSTQKFFGGFLSPIA